MSLPVISLDTLDEVLVAVATVAAQVVRAVKPGLDATFDGALNAFAQDAAGAVQNAVLALRLFKAAK